MTAAAVLVAVCAAAAGTARAAVAPFGLPQLTAAAHTVIVAQVDAVRSHWTGGAQATIVTDVDLRVGQLLKGDATATLRLSVPGGRVGQSAVLVSDAPSFIPGLTYLVFLDAAGRVVDGTYGAPQVSDGRVPALGDSLDGVAARVAQATGRAAAVLCSLPAATVGRPTGTAAGTRVGGPVIAAVSPRKAAAGVGAKVTITGSGFGIAQGLGRVQLFTGTGQRGLDAGVVSWSDSSIVCRVPIGSVAGMDAPSSGPLHVVTNDGQTSNDVPFTVVFSFDRSQWAVPSCTYRVDRRFPVSMAAAIGGAAATWDAAGTPFRFNAGGRCGPISALGDGHNDIVWSADLPAGYSALTSTLTVGSCIIEADTKLDSTIGWGDATAVSSATDTETIVLHELGHWLGLRDLYGQGDAVKTMYGVRSAGDVDRSLSAADQAGKLWIYQAARWDLVRPTTELQSAWGTLHGFVRLDFKVVDPRYSCGAAQVTVYVRRAGTLVPWVTFDAVPVGVTQRRRFKCTLAAGTYRFTAIATDMAGNRQASVKFKTLTVR